MSNLIEIGSYTFTSPVNRETSYGSNHLGVYESTMTLYSWSPTSYTIEWDIPKLEETYQIGVRTDTSATLIDYDGDFELPAAAKTLLQRHGIKVPDEF